MLYGRIDATMGRSSSTLPLGQSSFSSVQGYGTCSCAFLSRTRDERHRAIEVPPSRCPFSPRRNAWTSLVLALLVAVDRYSRLGRDRVSHSMYSTYLVAIELRPVMASEMILALTPYSWGKSPSAKFDTKQPLQPPWPSTTFPSVTRRSVTADSL